MQVLMYILCAVSDYRSFILFKTQQKEIDFLSQDYIALLLGHWYEIMALYYVTEISASRQDRRVLQKSKIIRFEFLSKWGMLQTSRYV